MLRCHARSLHRRAQVVATRWPAAFRSVVSRGCGWSRRAAAGGFDLRMMSPWRGGALALSQPSPTSRVDCHCPPRLRVGMSATAGTTEKTPGLGFPRAAGKLAH